MSEMSINVVAPGHDISVSSARMQESNNGEANMFDRAVGAQSKMVQSALDQQKDSKMEVTADW